MNGDYRGYAGKIESGRVRPGDEVVVLPRGSHAVVEAIDTPDGPLDLAVAGQSVVIRLGTDVDISRGDIIAATDAPPAPIRDLSATVCWLAERELDRRRSGTRSSTAHRSPRPRCRPSMAYSTSTSSLERCRAGDRPAPLPSTTSAVSGSPWLRRCRSTPTASTARLERSSSSTMRTAGHSAPASPAQLPLTAKTVGSPQL